MLKLALVSLDQRWLDKSRNLARCRELGQHAAQHGCVAAIFPEMTLTGYSLDINRVAESAEDSATVRQFGDLAQDLGMELIYGACLVDGWSGRPRNMLCHATRDGQSTAIYAKMHPFTFAREDVVLAAGNALGYVELPGIKLGTSVCYDLRFPELYAIMAPHCQAAVCIANWPAARVFHWRSLLVARAIENQMFMFGVNRVGVDGNDLDYEHSSMAVAPDGEVIMPLYSLPELDIVEVVPSDAVRYRENFPTVRDKRYRLYRELLGEET